MTEAKNAAYRLLTYRPRSRKELEGKLRERKYPAAIIKAVLDHCARLGYLNDRAFAEQWARSRALHRMFGRSRIGRELQDKGIDREIIREVLAGVFSEGREIETARRAAEKKIQTMKSADPGTNRRRLAGYLERKGFSFDIIGTVLRGIIKTEKNTERCI